MRPFDPRASGRGHWHFRRQPGAGPARTRRPLGAGNGSTGSAGSRGMWYFAYGSNLNSRAVVEWCRHFGHRPPSMKPGKPAVLDNYRLSFPIFSEYWGGGIADIVYDPGKYVAGALFDLSETDLLVLDQKVGRRMENGKEVGVYRRIEVK